VEVEWKVLKGAVRSRGEVGISRELALLRRISDLRIRFAGGGGRKRGFLTSRGEVERRRGGPGKRGSELAVLALTLLYLFGQLDLGKVSKE